MDIRKSFKQKKWPYLLVTGFWLVQVGLGLLADHSRAIEQYHISEGALIALQLVYSLPSLFIWVALVYVIMCFLAYLKAIGKSVEYDAFKAFTISFGVILANSVVTGLLNAYGAYATVGGDNAGLEKSLLIAGNYITIFASIIYFALLYKGSTILLKLSKKAKLVTKNIQRSFILIAAIGTGYVYMIMNNPNRQFPTSPDAPPTFGLSDPLILTTVAIPTIIAWFIGIAALMNISSFYHRTKGIIYRMLFRQIFIGLSLVIGLTISLQLLTQINGFLQDSGLALVLLIVTVIVLVMIYAFVLVARGASELKKIETLGEAAPDNE